MSDSDLVPPVLVGEAPAADLQVRAEALWEELGGDLCVCQRADVLHWCENCQRRIQLIREAFTRAASPRVQEAPAAGSLPKRDVQALVEALRIRALALTGAEWERMATAAMMKEAADMLEQLASPRVGAAPTLDGVSLIAAERERQRTAEGWTPEHDDTHDDGEMIEGARAYLSAAVVAEIPRRWLGPPPPTWPWNESWWKPSDDPIRDLVKAGALIAAEIDRLQRARVGASAPETEWLPTIEEVSGCIDYGRAPETQK